MANQHKIDIVNDLTQRFQDSPGIYFTQYTGLDVAQATNLRKQFRDNAVFYRVSKNTLTKIAAKNAGFDNRLDEVLVGQIGIAYANEDPTAPARIIKDFKKNNKDVLEVVGLVFEGEIFDAEKYKQIANIPSREVLIANFVGGLNQPMSKLVGTLNSAMSKLHGILTSLKETKT